MSTTLRKPFCLKLNAHWLPLRPETPENTFVDMAADRVRGLNIEYKLLEDGNYDFDNPINIAPVAWEDWINLPIREYDIFVRTQKLQIRVPTVVVCVNYGKVPVRTPKCSSTNIFKRDNYTCQYTGKKLKAGELSVDHVIPRDKGGKSTWENLVTCDKALNSKKGNKYNYEIGINLLKQPKAPHAVSAVSSINEILNRDWVHFLIK